MYSKSIVVSDRSSGYAQTNCIKTDEQLILPFHNDNNNNNNNNDNGMAKLVPSQGRAGLLKL
jgi:hypothetical protein